MTAPADLLTEEVFHAVAAPIAVAVAFAMLDAQLDVLGDVEGELADAFSKWSPATRQGATTYLRQSITQIREALDRIEATLPEEAAS